MPGVEKGYAEQQLCTVIEDEPHIFECGAELFPVEHSLEKAACTNSPAAAAPSRQSCAGRVF